MYSYTIAAHVSFDQGNMHTHMNMYHRLCLELIGQALGSAQVLAKYYTSCVVFHFQQDSGPSHRTGQKYTERKYI